MARIPGARAAARVRAAQAQVKESEWTPPDFGEERRTRIGASVVEQFVKGHDASDVLRELVQNEFDGGGDELTVIFGTKGLEVTGNGRGISSDGWARLSVIVGTGRVVGEGDADRVEAKRNGIGSKNFGLRSLFIFGNEIYVRSRGQAAVLDLRTLETGRVRDASSARQKGVRLLVPFRTETFEMLEPFTREREQRAFDLMAHEMLPTLVKLSLSGRTKGLRKLSLRSSRTGNALDWRQDAARVSCKVAGISATLREGILSSKSPGTKPERKRFEELEFSRSLDIPTKFRNRTFPAYFNAGPSKVRIAVSLPIVRQRIDHGRPGHYYYPLQAPHARTGVTASISAPFELNNDRSDVVDNEWCEWLASEAAALTVDLLQGDWFDRFGADAYRALAPNAAVKPSQYAECVLKLLSNRPCWPTRAQGQSRFQEASGVTVAASPPLDGFLAPEQMLHRSFDEHEEAKALALRSGIKPFTISSLIKLRCGAPKVVLATKIPDGDADFHFKNYDSNLCRSPLQQKMAEALTAVSKHLSNQHRQDLGSTPSTLTAKLTLRPAKELIRVAPDIWDVCPEPLGNRLHRELADCKPIANHAREFNETDWIVAACGRAAKQTISREEREALYAKLLAVESKLERRAVTALRDSPVAKNHRGEWTAPKDMLALRGSAARLLAPVVNMPSKEMAASPEILARLRIREKIERGDLIAFAMRLHERPQFADAFAKLLTDNLKLVTPAFVDEVESLEFIKSRAGNLAAPLELHLDTPTNRLCIDDARIVGSRHDALFKKLRIAEHPDAETLLSRIEDAKAAGDAPLRPDLLYPSLVDALRRERRSKIEFSDDEILFVNGDYHAPSEVLVGTLVPHVLDDALPIVRRTDALAQAYLSLGASAAPRDEHWAAFFDVVSNEWDDGNPLPAKRRRALLDAYRLRGPRGLPDQVDESTDCLLDRNGRLSSLWDLKSDFLVECDHPALAKALEDADSPVRTVDLNDRTRPFYSALGIKPLTAIAGTGKAVFGDEAAKPGWFKPQHRERLLSLLERPLFSRAVHAIAAAQRHLLVGYLAIDLDEVQRRLSRIDDIVFFADIKREYRLGQSVVRVSVETAVEHSTIGLVAPKTKLDFQQLVAQALAEIAGAESIAHTRALSTALLYLVLCRSNEDIRVYLDRMGIDHAAWNRSVVDDDEELLGEDVDETGEEIMRQVFEGLGLDGSDDPGNEPARGNDGGSKGEDEKQEDSSPPTSPPAPPPPFVLPELGDVELSIAEPDGRTIQPKPAQGGGWGSGSSGWTPRTPADVARDALVGRRGEELIYKMELERVRRSGRSNPEKYVIWTSLTDQGADHDIKSIDSDGNPRWLEVKSTTGVDGRFEWSKKEFQKALREGERYELWRVYKAATSTPVTKSFPNPAQMVAASQLVLDLGSLRASIESME